MKKTIKHKRFRLRNVKSRRKQSKLRNRSKRFNLKSKRRNRKTRHAKAKRGGAGSMMYKPDEYLTIDQLYNEPNFPDPTKGDQNCVDILIEKKTPILPTSISFSGKYTGEKYEKCKKTLQLYNLFKTTRESYLRYREIIKRFNERNKKYLESQGKSQNLTILQKEKNIEDLGNTFILQYIVDLFLQTPQSNTEELAITIKRLNPNWYDYILDKQNYTDMKWMQCTAKCVAIKQSPELLNKLINWIYETRNKVWKMRKPQDLIEMFDGYYTIQRYYDPKYDDTYIKNVVIHEPSKERYVKDKCWDIVFQIVQAKFQDAYGVDDQTYSPEKYETLYRDIYIDTFTRHYPTYIFENGDVATSSMNLEPNKITERYNTFIEKLANIGVKSGSSSNSSQFEATYVEGLNAAYDGNVISFESIKNNFYVKRVLRIIGLFMEGVTFPSLFYDLHTFNRWYIFYPYNDIKPIQNEHSCNDGLMIVANARDNIFHSDEEVEKIMDDFIHEKLNQNGYAYDYDKLIQKKKSEEYPRLRIIDIEKQIAFSVQINQVIVMNKHIVGRCVTITFLKNIFAQDLNDVKMVSDCLLIWEDIENAEISLNDCPIFNDGFLKPILSSLSPFTETDAKKQVDFMQKSPQMQSWRDEMEKVDG